MEVTRCGGAQHGQRFVDVLGLLVTGNDTAGRVCLFDEIVSVIGVDTCAAGRRLLDSSPKGIVFKGDRAACSRQRHAGHAILEVPEILRGAARVDLGRGIPVAVECLLGCLNIFSLSISQQILRNSIL